MDIEAAPQAIDLAQVNWPFCLLELKSFLKRLGPGQVLEVTVSDPAVLDTMKQVLDSSPDQVIGSARRGPLYVLTVLKG